LAKWVLRHHSPLQFTLDNLTLFVPFFKEEILEHEHHYENCVQTEHFIYTFMHMTFEQLLQKMKDLQVSSLLRKNNNGMGGNVWCV
jgi:hypothetical protein